MTATDGGGTERRTKTYFESLFVPSKRKMAPPPPQKLAAKGAANFCPKASSNGRRREGGRDLTSDGRTDCQTLRKRPQHYQSVDVTTPHTAWAGGKKTTEIIEVPPGRASAEGNRLTTNVDQKYLDLYFG